MSETEGINFIAWKAMREDRDYFKAAYSRTLDGEKRALEAAQAAVEQNTKLCGELAKLKLEHSALADRVAARLGACGRLRGCGSRAGFNECEQCHADRLALGLAGRTR